MITGGAGYIGSHCCVSLNNNGFNPIIIDNFSNSKKNVIKKLEKIIKKKITFYHSDIRNKKTLESIFKKYNCYAVIHCAGLKSIEESSRKTIDYFDNNIISTINLLECMKKFKIHKLIFSSSATVYNDEQKLPLKETDKVGDTNNPYGTSKYLIERILTDLAKFDNEWSIRIARYFNPISNHSTGLIRENPKGAPNNLIPTMIRVVRKKLRIFNIFGKNYKTKDGTGVRDYIHVMDLADGHVAMLKHNRMKKGLKIYNLGAGKGFSVLEVIKTFEKETGIYIPLKYTKRRRGDIAMSYCSPQKALKELNWRTKLSLKQAIKDLKINY